MSLDAHPELIGTVLVVGVLVLAAIRQVIAWWVQRSVAWPLIAVTTAGIVFVVSRVIHLSTHSTEVALYMIRVQYGIGFRFQSAVLNQKPDIISHGGGEQFCLGLIQAARGLMRKGAGDGIPDALHAQPQGRIGRPRFSVIE